MLTGTPNALLPFSDYNYDWDKQTGHKINISLTPVMYKKASNITHSVTFKCLGFGHVQLLDIKILQKSPPAPFCT